MAVVALVAACGGGGEGESSAPRIATAEDQGSFNTPCAYSHSAPNDPIVHPGHEDMSHRHDFFGATTTDADSGAESLLEGETTCRARADHAAYWVPSLLADGEPVVPTEMLAYYRVPVGANASQMEPPPNGLEMIAGDSESTEPQDPEVVAWSCGNWDEASPTPRSCGTGGQLWLRLRFDPCWDGDNLGSDDHRSHLAQLGEDGSCPESHPVLIPELTLEVRYPSPPEVELTLASGPATGGHGDALMAWEEDHISREVDVCLRANRDCDVVSASDRLDFEQLDPRN